jgi:hypothetical protein
MLNARVLCWPDGSTTHYPRDAREYLVLFQGQAFLNTSHTLAEVNLYATCCFITLPGAGRR